MNIGRHLSAGGWAPGVGAEAAGGGEVGGGVAEGVEVEPRLPPASQLVEVGEAGRGHRRGELGELLVVDVEQRAGGAQVGEIARER